MKTPNNLHDLKNMLEDKEVKVDFYNGRHIHINQIKIGFDSTKDEWTFNKVLLNTDQLKNILTNKNKIIELLENGR